MTKKAYTFDWKNYNKKELSHLLDVIGGDGHTIWSSPALVEQGVPATIVEQFDRTFKSDGSLKGSITRNGAVVEKMAGVYGLNVLWSMGNYFHVDTDKMGRGFQAQELTVGLRVAIGKLDD